MYIQEENKNRMNDATPVDLEMVNKVVDVTLNNLKGRGIETGPSSAAKPEVGEGAPLVIPEGQKMNIDGKYGPADDTFMYGTIEELNAARNTLTPQQEALTKDAIETLNAAEVGGDEGAPLVIPEGQKMNIDGKYGPADDKFMYGTIAELNVAREKQEPKLEALTKDNIEQLNATPAPAGDLGGGGRRTRRRNKKSGKKSGKKSRRQSKKGGKKHRNTGSKKSKKSRRYSSRK